MSKNRGFSLIEVLVVLGIIGILSTFITPRVMSYTAKAKEVKVKSVLESLRTASEMYYLEKGIPFMSTPGSLKTTDLKELENYLSNNIKGLFKEDTASGITMEIGGSRASADLNSAITYGGTVAFTSKNPDDQGTSDGIKIWVSPSEKIEEYTLNGEQWIEL